MRRGELTFWSVWEVKPGEELKLHAALKEFVWMGCSVSSWPGVVLWFGSAGMHCRAVMEGGPW